MLKIDEATLIMLEDTYPGIVEQVMGFENAELPRCGHCGSEDTAQINVGSIVRSINIAGSTTNIRLIPNGPKPGEFACNTCNAYLDDPKHRAVE
jgi:hypothetical protein